jgi:O-methyltransferase
VLSIARFLRNAASHDPSRRLRALRLAADWLIPDYRLTWFQYDWWRDASFNSYLDKFGERDGFNAHRRWMLHQLLKLVQDVPGHTAECGAFLGASSWLMCELGRTHHIFDSFEGLSPPDAVDGDYWQEGVLSASESAVLKNLAPYEPILHKGWIPDRFADVADSRFAAVHVDVDLHQPTKDCIEFFYPRLNTGGLFVCDDYGFTTCPGATKAVDDFMSDKPETIVSMDAGGCFFLKA